PVLRGAIRLQSFSKLACLFSLYAAILESGHTVIRGAYQVFPHGHVRKEGFFGIDGLPIFLPAETFEAWSGN
ncbi:TPA: hypothetical protein ACQ8KT_004296, partial [Escherichia coli]